MLRKTLVLALVISAAALSLVFPAINLNENSILITDFINTVNDGAAGGRVYRVTDASSIEQGPTATGLSFDGPYHFSFDSLGRIYVADHYHFRVVRMDDIFGTGWKVFTGSGSTLLSNSSGSGVKGVKIDASGRIYIIGPGGGIIRINDMDGSGFATFGAPLQGAVLSGPGSFNNPKDLAFDKQRRFYVADADNHRIVRFDDFQGSGWTTYGGTKGTGVGEFYRPDSVAIDSLGRIYIEDNRNDRIVRINDMTGAGWISIGDGAGGLTGGANAGQFSGPHDLKVDQFDRIWVADTGNKRIVRMDDMLGTGWVAFGINADNISTTLRAPKGIQVWALGRS